MLFFTRDIRPDPAARLEAPMLATTQPHHIVVVGAGFGGLAATRALARADVRVTLVDQRNTQTFQPLLYQVATATLAADDVAADVRGLLRRQRNVRVRMGRVVGIDLAGRALRLADGTDLAYDGLVLAAGTVSNDFGISGVHEHGFPLKSVEDATRLRAHVLRQIEAAAAAPDQADAGRLTFVVAGAGPTGVEMAGALSELVAQARADVPELADAPARILLVEPTGTVLPPYAPSTQAYTERALLARGVELRLDTSVRAVDADTVTLGDGEVIASRTLVWAGGVRAHPLAAALGVPLTRGSRVPVTDQLHLATHPEVFVVGDMAGPAGDDAALPQVAQVAIQMGTHAARVIRARLRGRTVPAFRYADRGQMAIVGRGAGVAELARSMGGARIRGPLGWLAWLALHLVYLPGAHNRAQVLVRWLAGLASPRGHARSILEPRRGAAHADLPSGLDAGGPTEGPQHDGWRRAA
jgi:NADH:ubiquinone reductase (H+-translocating)